MTVPRPGLVDEPGIAVQDNALWPVDAFMRIGYEHLDRLITYPYPNNLSTCTQPIRMSERHRGNGHLFADPLRAASIAAFAVLRSTPVRSL